jgi:MFS transporter, ACS family, glucarate transporter
LISEIGWRLSFIILGLLGIFLAVLWYRLFRDNPEDHKGLSPEERAYILENRQKSDNSGQRSKLSGRRMFSSANMWLAMLQYISSNFIFFFCLSWMFIYLQERFELSSVKTGLFASLPLFAGALGNWVSGIFVDKIYSSGNWPLSRRIPAMIGFLLSAAGIIAIIFANDIYTAVLFLSLAVFGADMTLSPSWSFCIDIGKHHSGAISGTMNMAGNFGALATTIAFPYLRSWTGSDQPFFIISAALCLIAVFAWWFMNPKKSIVD